MPVDLFAILRALLRAEAARTERGAPTEPERPPARAAEPTPAPAREEHPTC
ncbi:hypothetical protein Q5762_24035 [Streptomyces sp. P9(2023)]|uniref:hypothetical protein n=1 Tax=Streptomyces sp. P9(2023) TaxID=3064394 RepID=UPI0028F44962|nr:hypothetical protein [Streptomyces sp. P9(2023)]MDT9691358.1 hypothetical protein [Streptomyces sp. P9(2023)]